MVVYLFVMSLLMPVRWFDIRCHSLCICSSLVWSLTGEARMFWLDEVGNSKKIVIKGKLARPASPLQSDVFVDVFWPNGIRLLIIS